MKRESEYTKLAKGFGKLAARYCNKVKLEDYINMASENYAIKYKHNNGKTLGIYTEQYMKKAIRTNMVNTLIYTEYARGSKEWNTCSAVAFIEEVMDVFSMPFLEENSFKASKKLISDRYNVPTARLKTQVSKFIKDYENGKDKYDIGAYFTPYDIFMWKYGNDVNLMQEALENNKLTKDDFKIMQELYEIEK